MVRSIVGSPGEQVEAEVRRMLRSMHVRCYMAPDEADEMLGAEAWQSALGCGPFRPTAGAPKLKAGAEDSSAHIASAAALGLRKDETCLGILSDDSDMCVYFPSSRLESDESGSGWHLPPDVDTAAGSAHPSVSSGTESNGTTGKRQTSSVDPMRLCGWIPFRTGSFEPAPASAAGPHAEADAVIGRMFGGTAELEDSSDDEEAGDTTAVMNGDSAGAAGAAAASGSPPAPATGGGDSHFIALQVVTPGDLCDLLEIPPMPSKQRAAIMHEACAVAGGDFTAPLF